ncbi:MAG: PA14 domain-containing protein [Chloroflexota bacterium]|nr:PA14 domain-containing protein [Chloroflexota bacterium]
MVEYGSLHPDNAWRGEYFNNRNLSGAPVMVRNDQKIDFDWKAGSPDRSIGNDNFSVRWTRNVRLPSGCYQFTTQTDDGVRLYVDGKVLIDAWQPMSLKKITREIYLNEGLPSIRVEYYEQAGGATARAWWNGPLSQVTVGNLITCVPDYPSYSWIKVYRLGANGQWEDMKAQGYGSFEATGWLKVDGLPVDYARYGDAGHPYRIEQWVDGQLAHSVGDTSKGQPAFRIYAGKDSLTPWQCPQK